jgi:hypothetical protein
MAASIIYHPTKLKLSRHSRKYDFSVDTYSYEELLLILEHADPFIAPIELLQTWINGTLHFGDSKSVQLRGWLIGIHDCRTMISAVLD